MSDKKIKPPPEDSSGGDSVVVAVSLWLAQEDLASHPPPGLLRASAIESLLSSDADDGLLDLIAEAVLPQGEPPDEVCSEPVNDDWRDVRLRLVEQIVEVSLEPLLDALHALLALLVEFCPHCFLGLDLISGEDDIVYRLLDRVVERLEGSQKIVGREALPFPVAGFCPVYAVGHVQDEVQMPVQFGSNVDAVNQHHPPDPAKREEGDVPDSLAVLFLSIESVLQGSLQVGGYSLHGGHGTLLSATTM